MGENIWLALALLDIVEGVEVTNGLSFSSEMDEFLVDQFKCAFFFFFQFILTIKFVHHFRFRLRSSCRYSLYLRGGGKCGKKGNKKTTNNLGSSHQIGKDKYSKILKL